MLIYDDFRADNRATVRRVLRFLDVDDTSPSAPVEANPSVRVRSVRLDGMVRALQRGQGPLLGATKTAVKALTPARLRGETIRALRSGVIYGRPEPADEELMRELRRRFRDEVVALSEYLDRDLVTLWGYDRVE